MPYSLGSSIRRMFGPFEHGVAEMYRRIFVDLDKLADLMRVWVPRAHRILEVGCGEGFMTERIVKSYPSASVTAIDITSKIGRLFRGDASAITFCQETVESVANREPGSFDLVVLADVMHHVPINERGAFLYAIDRLLTPNGNLLFKDWVISASPIHWLCNISDRYLTGDNVSYFTMSGINAMLTSTFGPDSIRHTGTVWPWRNNVAFLVQRHPPLAVQNAELDRQRCSTGTQ
jgi:2-polyprenyl-6-hydroxyphenyl methylase/3-demethylubiquinone-9 3-methyltransferase